MTIISAQLNSLRMSPRKVRLVAGLMRRKSVAVAHNQLMQLTKRAAHPLVKLLNSAVANAEHTYKLDRDHLWVKEFRVDEGPKLKRHRAKGFGRANPIEKKTSRVRLMLESRTPAVTSKEIKS